MSLQRRVQDARFATRYFVGNGIDIGGGTDSLIFYSELFPLISGIAIYDIDSGDAQDLANVPDNEFDFCFSSHCLEHVNDPVTALRNWVRVCKPGGHIIVIVPDEDLYEQGVWPSTFNADHRCTFTLAKRQSWSPVSVNVLELLWRVADMAMPLSINLLDHAHRFKLPRFDRTKICGGEAGIEFILRKNE